mmetsp:Transcript_37242/g.107291  ORF Transcript_37242/g.107291 Transcript_37242/m.107291 type:complete len:211 (-) Transcript_37242:346-978(-)
MFWQPQCCCGCAAHCRGRAQAGVPEVPKLSALPSPLPTAWEAVGAPSRPWLEAWEAAGAPLRPWWPAHGRRRRHCPWPHALAAAGAPSRPWPVAWAAAAGAPSRPWPPARAWPRRPSGQLPWPAASVAAGAVTPGPRRLAGAGWPSEGWPSPKASEAEAAAAVAGQRWPLGGAWWQPLHRWLPWQEAHGTAAGPQQRRLACLEWWWHPQG